MGSECRSQSEVRREMTYSAIVLAGGSGRRMGQEVKKQYMQLCDRPVIYYPLAAFEKSGVDEVILVVSPEDEDFVREDILKKYSFSKVSHIVGSGEERYDSVYNGLKAASGKYVLIHDGARAFVTVDIIESAMEAVKTFGACVVGMPAKDTIKISDEEGFVSQTPDRNRLWTIQTPQCFIRDELISAYEKLRQTEDGFLGITDDAMIMERMGHKRIRLIEGSYDNIKLTTPEDISTGMSIIERYQKGE